MEATQGSSTGVRLASSRLLEQWLDTVSGRVSHGAPPPLDWFLTLEAISDRSSSVTERRPVRIGQLANRLGRNPNFVYEGPIYRQFDMLEDALAMDEDRRSKRVGAPCRLYQQARMATYLHYRAGFSSHLEVIPFTAEAAVHGYTRVVLEWARAWPGLTLATSAERGDFRSVLQPAAKDADQRARRLRRESIALPLIVRKDLLELLQLVHLEAADIGSTDDIRWVAEVATETLLTQLSIAASHVVEDETLSSLTAANLVRATANEALGGALFRVRIRAKDRDALLLEVLDDVRAFMVDPHGANVGEGSASRGLAELEHQFAALRAAMRGTIEAGDD